MERVKAFLIFDGALVAAGLFAFYWAYQRNKPENHFRDDLWKKIKDPAQREQAKLAYEDQVDKKILLDHKPDAAEAKEAKPHSEATKPEFRIPNFRGKPHEILGIPAEANAELVTRAHKYWIKRYHPDRVSHLGGQYVEQARRRAEQLNSARQHMLVSLKK